MEHQFSEVQSSAGFVTNGIRAVGPRTMNKGFEIDEDRRQVLCQLIRKWAEAMDRHYENMLAGIQQLSETFKQYRDGEEPELLGDAVKEEEPESEEIEQDSFPDNEVKLTQQEKHHLLPQEFMAYNGAKSVEYELKKLMPEEHFSLPTGPCEWPARRHDGSKMGGDPVLQLDTGQFKVQNFISHFNSFGKRIFDLGLESENAKLNSQLYKMMSGNLKYWNADCYAKVNDIYLNVDALANTLATNVDKPHVYIGYMKFVAFFSEKGKIWYEPDWLMVSANEMFDDMIKRYSVGIGEEIRSCVDAMRDEQPCRQTIRRFDPGIKHLVVFEDGDEDAAVMDPSIVAFDDQSLEYNDRLTSSVVKNGGEIDSESKIWLVMPNNSCDGIEFISLFCNHWKGAYRCNSTHFSGCVYNMEAEGYCSIVNYSGDLPQWARYFPEANEGGQTSLADYCSYFVAYFDGSCADTDNTRACDSMLGEVKGSKSRCMASSLVRIGLGSTKGNGCYKHRCINKSLVVALDEMWKVCPQASEPIKYFGFNCELVCCAYRELCNESSDEWAVCLFEELDCVNEGENGTLFAEMMMKDLPQVMPGTRKTLFAKAIANSTSATFLHIVGSELIQRHMGGCLNLVRDLFRVAYDLSPLIVFIDEIHDLATKRDDTHLGGECEIERAMLELLNLFDGFDSRGDAKVILATNKIKSLSRKATSHEHNHQIQQSYEERFLRVRSLGTRIISTGGNCYESYFSLGNIL